MPCKKEEDEVNIFEEQVDYSRDGHLFRERFKSEPVNDMAYSDDILYGAWQEDAVCGGDDIAVTDLSSRADGRNL